MISTTQNESKIDMNFGDSQHKTIHSSFRLLQTDVMCTAYNIIVLIHKN